MTSKFVFEDTKPSIADADILADLRRVAQERGLLSMPKRVYQSKGRFSVAVVQKRFGSWNSAVSAIGLMPAGLRDIAEDDLFENLRAVWIKIGRQPRKREMVAPVSSYTHDPYTKRFGGWLDAVRAFLASCEDDERAESGSTASRASRGPRDPSLRLRFLVMRRDRFRCCHCGASPSAQIGVELHVDHVVAWSCGGTTSLENLQTLCSPCNLGKSALTESSG